MPEGRKRRVGLPLSTQTLEFTVRKKTTIITKHIHVCKNYRAPLVLGTEQNQFLLFGFSNLPILKTGRNKFGLGFVKLLDLGVGH